MKDVIKIALGISIALLFFAIVGLLIIAYSSPSEYDKCWTQCVLKSEIDKSTYCTDSSGHSTGCYDMYKRERLPIPKWMIEVRDVICPEQCKPYRTEGFGFLIEVLTRIVHRLAP